MSNQNAKTILLREPIEYLIFSKEPINYECRDQTRCLGHLMDCTENTLLLLGNPGIVGILPEQIGQEVELSCNYKSKRLKFSVALHHFDEYTGVLTFSKPHQGQLINCRAWERTLFNPDDTQFKATLKIDTILGDKTFHTEHFRQFSYQSLSLYISRSQGIVVPGDSVTSIVIHTDSKTIYAGAGIVSRIEQLFTDDKIYIVINLDDPNHKPKYDIEPDKRQSNRYIFHNQHEAFIEFIHPFSGSRKTAAVYDISNSGISIYMPDSTYAMPIGLQIENVSLQLPMQTRINVNLMVKGYFQKDPGDTELKVSMELVESSPSVVKEVSNYVQHSLSDHLQDATADDLNDLWYFYFETGFIYQGKRRQIQQNSESVKNTLSKLLKSNTPLIKKILYKENGEIKGHVTAIKIFDNTLMVQHLNALNVSSGNAAMHVIRAITSYFLDNRANLVGNNRFICFYYRPDNLYPDLVFGSAVNLIDDDRLCWIDKFQFCLPNDLSFSEHTEDDIQVFEAKETDLSLLESLLIQKGDFRTLRLEGLVRETLVDMEITQTYQDIGLYRYRRVFVAESLENKERVYAVCTYASPGLNLSELTNSIKLYYDEGSVLNSIQPLIDEVSAHALDSYAKTELTQPTLLLKAEQPAPRCFSIAKNYTLFALDIRHTRKFKTATEHIFSNIKKYIKEKKLSAHSS